MTTGKNKVQFVSWYVNNNWHLKSDDDYVGVFDFLEKLPFEMKIGVYLSYFRSKEIYFELRMLESSNDWMFRISRKDIMSPLYTVIDFNPDNTFESDILAYKEAFKQADIL